MRNPVSLTARFVLTTATAAASALFIYVSAAAAADCQYFVRAGYQQICQGNHEQAVATLTSAVNADPSSVEARRYLAIALLKSGLANDAATQLEYVRRMSPGSAGDTTLLGNAYFYAGQYEKALQCYRQALAADSRSDEARAGLVQTYLAAGKNAAAEAACREALKVAHNAETRDKLESLMRGIKGDSRIAPKVLEE